jgi:hypothetical protein
MNYTMHAETRTQQRGISTEMVEILRIYGEYHGQKGGTGILKMDRRAIKRFSHDMRRILASLNRKNSPYAIVSGGQVITVAHEIHKTQTL